MMRRRRRRFGPKWTYSNQQTLLVNQTTGTTIPGFIVDYVWILPPARAQFLMNTKQRDRMQFSGAHLWLDFYWRQEGGTTGLPDVNFACYKSEIVSDTGLPDFTPMNAMFTEPSTPASITSWDEDDDDGTNPFCWQHFIKGNSPPNAVVSTFDYDGSSGADHAVGNQANRVHGASTDNPLYTCRKFMVTQEWQPDVTIRTKRTIKKGEGIVFVMAVANNTMLMSSITEVRFRTLTK